MVELTNDDGTRHIRMNPRSNNRRISKLMPHFAITWSGNDSGTSTTF